MTNPITDAVPKTIPALKTEIVDKKGDQDVSRSTETDSRSDTKSMQNDRVELSSAAQSELDKAGFDHEKVEQIKQALADGNYPVDPRRVAESFAEIEKLL